MSNSSYFCNINSIRRTGAPVPLRLSARDRQRLIEELEELEDSSEELEDFSRGKKTPPQGPYARTLAAAGVVHADFTDLSTDKYKHVAAAAADQRDDE